MVYNGYEITKLNNLRNLEEETQLWFNINVCLFKRQGWNLQLTNIYTEKISEEDAEQILYLFKNKLEETIENLLDFISKQEYNEDKYEVEFYTGYELNLIEQILKEKLNCKNDIYNYNNKRFIIWNNYVQNIHILRGGKNLEKQQITIDIDNLTDEEILLILKHRKNQGNTWWDTVKKEPFYIFKDFRRAFMRELTRALFMYLIIKYGLLELIKGA